MRLLVLSCVFFAAMLVLIFSAPPGWPCRSCQGGQALIWQGATVWRDRAQPELGGLSGLTIQPGGQAFLALSDRVHLFSGILQRDPKTHALHSVALTGQETLLNPGGAPLTPFNSDGEALAVGPDGMLFMGFEGLARVLAYPAGDGETRRAKRLHPWDHFRDLWGNAGIEALAPLPGGGLIAITQGGQTFVWRGEDTSWRAGGDLPDIKAFQVSGADLGPQGHLWVLERQQGWTGFITRIRRFGIDGDTLGPGHVMLEGRIGWRENYEGISLWCNAAGQTVVTLVSDDGFSRLQRTVLAEFIWLPDPDAQPTCSNS